MRMRFITASTSLYVNPGSDDAANFTKTQSLNLAGAIVNTAAQR